MLEEAFSQHLLFCVCILLAVSQIFYHSRAESGGFVLWLGLRCLGQNILARVHMFAVFFLFTPSFASFTRPDAELSRSDAALRAAARGKVFVICSASRRKKKLING